MSKNCVQICQTFLSRKKHSILSKFRNSKNSHVAKKPKSKLNPKHLTSYLNPAFNYWILITFGIPRSFKQLKPLTICFRILWLFTRTLTVFRTGYLILLMAGAFRNIHGEVHGLELVEALMWLPDLFFYTSDWLVHSKSFMQDFENLKASCDTIWKKVRNLGVKGEKKVVKDLKKRMYRFLVHMG